MATTQQPLFNTLILANYEAWLHLDLVNMPGGVGRGA